MARLDLSPLYNRPAPSAFQAGLSNIGGIMTAMMERRRREQELAAEQEAKAAELQFRRDQEKRLTKRQEMLDDREDTREAARDQRDQHAQRIKGYEAVSKAKTPQERAFLAQLYGGTVEQAKPDYSAGPDDPLGTIDFLENVEEDDSSPLGFSYGINPEHERRTQQAARTQVMTMPGGQPINLPDPEQEEDIYEGAKQAIGMFPPGSLQQAELLRQIELSKRLRLDAKGTYGAVNDVQQRQASERNARIMAARQEQQFRRQGERDDDREAAAARKKLQALQNRANDADRELAIQEEIIDRNGGVPVAGKDRELYDQSLKRYASAQALVESGNPESEASDPTKRAIQDRAGAGRFSAIGAAVGLPTGASATTAKAKIAAERKALDDKLQGHARTYGLPSPRVGGGTAQYGPVTTKTTKRGEQVRVRKNLSTGQWEEAQ
jgi:hypothetical protein